MCIPMQVEKIEEEPEEVVDVDKLIAANAARSLDVKVVDWCNGDSVELMDHWSDYIFVHIPQIW